MDQSIDSKLRLQAIKSGIYKFSIRHAADGTLSFYGTGIGTKFLVRLGRNRDLQTLVLPVLIIVLLPRYSSTFF